MGLVRSEKTLTEKSTSSSPILPHSTREPPTSSRHHALGLKDGGRPVAAPSRNACSKCWPRPPHQYRNHRCCDAPREVDRQPIVRRVHRAPRWQSTARQCPSMCESRLVSIQERDLHVLRRDGCDSWACVLLAKDASSRSSSSGDPN